MTVKKHLLPAVGLDEAQRRTGAGVQQPRTQYGEDGQPYKFLVWKNGDPVDQLVTSQMTIRGGNFLGMGTDSTATTERCINVSSNSRASVV